MDVFTLRDNIALLRRTSLMDAFNNSVRNFRRLLKGGTYAIDSTIVETPQAFPGSGKSVKEKKTNKGESSSFEYIYGFKLFALYEVKSRIIVAMTIVPANVSEHKHFLSTIKQGVRNCGRGKIKVIVADRGYLDGKHLWELKNQMKIDFIVPAKKGMVVREDAIALGKKMPKNRFSEWAYGKDKCKGYGIDGLLTYIEYNNPNITKHNKNTNGTPINAVVVTQWCGKKVSEEKRTVFLTSLPAEDAASIAQSYRLRSLIENCGFRELKQASFLKHIPRRISKSMRGKKSDKTGEIENTAYIHIMMCVFAHTLFFAFLGWRKKQIVMQKKDEQDEVAVPVRRWRMQQSPDESKIFIVVEGKYYAFFEVYELLDILNIRQKYKVRRN